MKVLVIGATGDTGRALVETCLDAGHDVSVIVRTPEKLGRLNPKCTVFTGDLSDSALLGKALEGIKVVFSGLGPVKGNPSGAITAIYSALIPAMQTANVSRLIAVTGAGVKDEKDAPSMVRNVIRGIMKLVAAGVLEDSEAAYALIKRSGLSWTIARVPVLVNEGGVQGKLTGDYQPSKPMKMNRTAIAQWMIEEATANQFVQESPMLKPAG